MPATDLFWTLAGFILSLLIFSYLFGDNPLFRLASYLFVGVTSGYVAVVILYQVLLPRLVYPLLGGEFQERSITLVPLLLGALLLTKISRRFSSLGNVPMAYLVGVGAAVVIGGAVLGTILPQVQATLDVFDFQTGAAMASKPVAQLIEGSIVVVGTVATLVYFHFGAALQPNRQTRRHRLVEWLAAIGQVFIAITLGALFTGVYAAALTALIDRLEYFAATIRMLTTFF